MNLDYTLVGGLILGVLSIPAMLAAWADGRPFLPRLGILVLGVLMVEFCYFSDPTMYAPSEWMETAMRVAAYIIP